MIALLNDQFVNVWLLARDLERTAAASEDPDLKRLCAVLRAEYKYPVSSHVVSTGEGIEHLGALEVRAAFEGPMVYLPFLRDALGQQIATE